MLVRYGRWWGGEAGWEPDQQSVGQTGEILSMQAVKNQREKHTKYLLTGRCSQLYQNICLSMLSECFLEFRPPVSVFPACSYS